MIKEKSTLWSWLPADSSVIMMETVSDGSYEH